MNGRRSLAASAFLAVALASFVVTAIFRDDIAGWLTETLQSLPLPLAVVIVWLPFGLMAIGSYRASKGGHPIWGSVAALSFLACLAELLSLVRRSNAETIDYKIAMRTETGSTIRATVLALALATVAGAAIGMVRLLLKPDKIAEPRSQRSLPLALLFAELAGLVIALAVTGFRGTNAPSRPMDAVPLAGLVILAWFPQFFLWLGLYRAVGGARRPWTVIAGITAVITVGESIALFATFGQQRGLPPGPAGALLAGVITPLVASMVTGGGYWAISEFREGHPGRSAVMTMLKVGLVAGCVGMVGAILITLYTNAN